MAQRRVMPSALLGTMIFVLTEIMFFIGMISAFLITKASAPGGLWPPPGQPRLPIEVTGVNTALLLISGALIWVAASRFFSSPKAARLPLIGAVALGVVFVIVQGSEWVLLLGQGLTLYSGPFGAFFYLIVGTHGLHVVAGVAAMVAVLRWQSQGVLTGGGMNAMRLYWLFVVGLWPLLYWQVYS